MAVLHIILPATLVLRTVYVSINAIPICLVIPELAVVDITLCMPESSFSFSLVETPAALVFGTIWPYLYTKTMSLLAIHLSPVYAPIGVKKLWHEVKSWFIDKVLLHLLLTHIDVTSLLHVLRSVEHGAIYRVVC
jgi:hypothetical protein